PQPVFLLTAVIFVIGSGGRIRTYDLWVMSPASYRAAPPRADCHQHSMSMARHQLYQQHQECPNLFGLSTSRGGLCAAPRAYLALSSQLVTSRLSASNRWFSVAKILKILNGASATPARTNTPGFASLFNCTRYFLYIHEMAASGINLKRLISTRHTWCDGMGDMRKSHISSPRWAALLIAPLLVAGLAACSNSDETPAEQASPSTVTETVTETATPEQDSGDAEDQDDKSQDAVSDAQDLRVTAEGQGVLFLRLDNESSVNDDSKTLEGKLISGPGGCLSVQPGGRPEMLVF